MKLIEPDHRCSKCGTPLEFQNNHIRSEEEKKPLIEAKKKKMSFIRRLFYNEYWDFMIDTNRQEWQCPKCFEEYSIEL